MIPTREFPKGLEDVDDIMPKYVVFFYFASAYVHKGACLVVSLLEVKEVRVTVMTYAETHDFAIAKDWCDVNELSLYLGVDKIRTICS